MMINEWEQIFEKKIAEVATLEDPSHDLLHFKRVVQLSKSICLKEGGRLEVVVPAAWLHDFVIVPKDSPLRSKASQMAAEKAISYLLEIGYPSEYHKDIYHAIEAHSFSANIEALTPEARIVQDADRLDGLGAIGIARCFVTAALMKRPLYNSDDPFCEQRPPDDSNFTIDHFYVKLFKIAQTLKTEAGRIEGQRRLKVMEEYLSSLRREIL